IRGAVGAGEPFAVARRLSRQSAHAALRAARAQGLRTRVRRALAAVALVGLPVTLLLGRDRATSGVGAAGPFRLRTRVRIACGSVSEIVLTVAILLARS